MNCHELDVVVCCFWRQSVLGFGWVTINVCWQVIPTLLCQCYLGQFNLVYNPCKACVGHASWVGNLYTGNGESARGWLFHWMEWRECKQTRMSSQLPCRARTCSASCAPPCIVIDLQHNFYFWTPSNESWGWAEYWLCPPFPLLGSVYLNVHLDDVLLNSRVAAMMIYTIQRLEWTIFNFLPFCFYVWIGWGSEREIVIFTRFWGKRTVRWLKGIIITRHGCRWAILFGQARMEQWRVEQYSNGNLYQWLAQCRPRSGSGVSCIVGNTITGHWWCWAQVAGTVRVDCGRPAEVHSLPSGRSVHVGFPSNEHRCHDHGQEYGAQHEQTYNQIRQYIRRTCASICFHLALSRRHAHPSSASSWNATIWCVVTNPTGMVPKMVASWWRNATMLLRFRCLHSTNWTGATSVTLDIVLCLLRDSMGNGCGQGGRRFWAAARGSSTSSWKPRPMAKVRGALLPECWLIVTCCCSLIDHNNGVYTGSKFTNLAEYSRCLWWGCTMHVAWLIGWLCGWTGMLGMGMAMSTHCHTEVARANGWYWSSCTALACARPTSFWLFREDVTADCWCTTLRARVHLHALVHRTNDFLDQFFGQLVSRSEGDICAVCMDSRMTIASWRNTLPYHIDAIKLTIVVPLTSCLELSNGGNSSSRAGGSHHSRWPLMRWLHFGGRWTALVCWMHNRRWNHACCQCDKVTRRQWCFASRQHRSSVSFGVREYQLPLVAWLLAEVFDLFTRFVHHRRPLARAN